jgi:hypothetical protein
MPVGPSSKLAESLEILVQIKNSHFHRIILDAKANHTKISKKYRINDPKDKQRLLDPSNRPSL